MHDLPDIEISMIRPTLDNLPHYDLPEGYSLHWYEPGDEAAWTAIHVVADRYNHITPTLFAEQFGHDTAVLQQRQCYLKDPAGNLIGTTSAWFNDDYHGMSWGRIHWVAIVPEMQGKGLAKPLLAAVCGRLKDLGHERAYLDTSAARLPAVGLYLKFGFQPEILKPEDETIWREVLARLQQPGG